MIDKEPSEQKEPSPEAFSTENYDIAITNLAHAVSIQVTDKKTAKIFTKNISNSAASQISHELFNDKESMYQALLDGLKKTHGNISVSLNENASLTYVCETNIGSIKKEFKFSIDLEEQSGDPIEQIEKKIKELSTKMLDLENVMPSLNQYRTRYQNLFMEKLGNFELKLAEIENRFEVPRYNISSKHVNSFIFSAENSSAKFQGEEATCLFAQQACKKNGVSRFSIQASSSNFYFGIAPNSLIENQSCYQQAGTIFCSMADCSIDQSGTSVSSRYLGKSVSFLTIATDLTSGIICFEVGGIEIFRGNIDKDLIASNEYYPCIEFLSKNSTASFLRSA